MKTTILLSDEKKLTKKIQSPLYRTDNFLSAEDGDGMIEVTMDSKRITDRKPVHIGVAILQYSKLMLLEFVEFLRTYLNKGSYALVYSGKTSLLLIKVKIFLRH